MYSSMHSRFLPAKYQGKAFSNGISFIIQYTSKANHNNILIFALVGCITSYPERMVATIWRNIRDIRFDFLDVVPVPLDFSIRDVRP